MDADLVVNATVFSPDLAMLRKIRRSLGEIVDAPRQLAPLIDPNLHSCGSVYPRGVAELAHPDTGVCSTDIGTGTGDSCCNTTLAPAASAPAMTRE